MIFFKEDSFNYTFCLEVLQAVDQFLTALRYFCMIYCVVIQVYNNKFSAIDKGGKKL